MATAGEGTAVVRLDEVLKWLTETAKFPMMAAFPVAKVMVEAGFRNREEIGAADQASFKALGVVRVHIARASHNPCTGRGDEAEAAGGAEGQVRR